ncbi:MAG: response regulator [Clostridiales bacterium]|jgi:YesN/AraC family two-component response regulator|nr:response regulator [Clostridiales bacterium]
MLKLMIADDERTIREAVSTLIDWNSLEIELAAICKNGLEAWEALSGQKIDIALADIRMPGFSGLELAAKARQAGLGTEFILLTGHESFEYAHRAISEKVRHYLLKPCNEADIVQAVKEAAASVHDRRRLEQLPPQPGDYAQAAEGAYSDYVQKILDQVEARYADPGLTLKGIAETVLYMNPDYVSRQFLLQTGQRFAEHLSAFRIRKAQWLLADKGRLSVGQVAEQVGYGSSPKYFSHLFRKTVGMGPREYVNAVHGKRRG